jgi:hypothetical protein
MQHRIHPRHGVVPPKAKWRQQLFGSTGGRHSETESDPSNWKNSAHCPAVEIEAIRFRFIISVRVASIFDLWSLPLGTLKSAKMRVRGNSVNLRKFSASNVRAGNNFAVWGTLVSIFQSRFFFVRRKINFSFFLVDFRGRF